MSLLSKLSKLYPIYRIGRVYPGVQQIGAPRYLRLLGLRTRCAIKGHFSQFGQDRFVADELLSAIDAESFDHLFVDVGCNDPYVHSNSYYFESELGFKVLAIDALQEIKDLWQNQRPNAQVIVTAVGERTGQVSFDVVAGPEQNSMFSSVRGASSKVSADVRNTRTVSVRTLTDIFAEHQIDRVAILSMDIEGYEIPALTGLDFGKTQIGALIIENNGNAGIGSDQLRSLLLSNGYVYWARVWNLDDIFVHPSVARHLNQSAR
jgi:FkbM family methyltransferase